MKKINLFLAAVLCVPLLAFAGCGGNDADVNDADDGTVMEETVDTNDDNGSGNGDTVTEDMADDAKNAIDDVEDDIDGNDDNGAAKENKNN